MGSTLEINDTLQITVEQGFPSAIFDLAKHRNTPVTLKDVKDTTFEFHDKPGARFFQSDPVRVYLVHNINNKWLFWGRIYVQSQRIEKKFAADGTWAGEWMTSGTYKIVDIYDPAYQETFTRREAPSDRNFFSTGP